MGKKSQSAINYEENVLDWLLKDGMTIEECAKKSSISLSHAYKILGVVAKKAGLDKKRLLKRPHKEHAKFTRVSRGSLSTMDPETFNLHCDSAITEIDMLLGEIRDVITELKELLEEEV